MKLGNRKFTMLVLAVVMIVLLVVSQTGLAADNRVFFGLIGLFLLSQVVWYFYLRRVDKRENIARLISKQFPDD